MRLQNSPTDRDLVEAVLDRGDERAFRTLYRRHTPRLYLFVLRFVGGAEEDAEDVVQEIWIRACRHMNGFRWDSAFSTWLHAIGLNVSKDLLRRRSRNPVPSRETVPEPPAPRRSLDAGLDLETAIAKLPDGSRQILILHDIEGMKHREIAEILGITEGTSKSQLHHARRALRAHLRSRRAPR